MQYTSPADLPELTYSADRAQRLIDATLTDLETMPAASSEGAIDFRVNSITKVTDAIYRLTAVRKTIIALRASMTPNITGLRALTESLRGIHETLRTLQSAAAAERKSNKSAPAPRPPSDPTLRMPRIPRFATNWPPDIDEIIRSPRLIHTNQHSASVAASLIASRQSVKSAGPESGQSVDSGSVALSNSEPNPQSTASTKSTSSTPSTPNASETQIPADKPKLDPAAALIARLPASITDPNFKLPEASDRAADYAPLLKIDHVPQTKCIPTLPLAVPDLATRINAQFARITDTTINLRADILYSNPKPPAQQSVPSRLPSFKPSHPSPSSDLSEMSDPSDLFHPTHQADQSHASHASSPLPPEDPPDLDHPPPSSLSP